MSEFNIEVQGGLSVRLPTAGKYCDRDIIVTASGSGTEEVENLIDESGVLGTTDETVTVTEKVEQLIDKAENENLWYEASKSMTHIGRLFMNAKYIPKAKFENVSVMEYICQNNNNIERFDNLIVSNDENFNAVGAFDGTTKLKYVRGFKVKRFYRMSYLFRNSGVEVIEEPFDLTGAVSGNVNSAFSCAQLREIRFVENSISIPLTFTSLNLSPDSKNSIFNGLATVETAMTLTLPANLKILQLQVDSANSKGWTVAGGTVVSEEEYYG